MLFSLLTSTALNEWIARGANCLQLRGRNEALYSKDDSFNRCLFLWFIVIFHLLIVTQKELVLEQGRLV